MNTLEDVQYFLNRKVVNINNGGCGISALAMYRWLKEHGQLAKDTAFIYCHSSMEDYTYCENKNALKTFTTKKSFFRKIFSKSAPCSATHVVLLHKGTYIDSNGVINISNFVTLKTQNEDFVLKSINNKRGKWNKEFKRTEVKKIIENIDIKFSDVKIF
jgi:hypothetical protein